MNRVALLVALGYLGLALVAGGIYVSSVAKFVDYSDAIFRFGEPGRVRVDSANATQDPGSGNWTITVRWRFDNAGRLPIAVSNFLFELYVDNRSDSRPYYDPAKLAVEYYGLGSWYMERTTAPRIPPGGSYDRTWTFNATGADAAKVVPDPDTGKVWLLLTGVQLVFYVSDIDSRQSLAVSSEFRGV